MKFDVYGGRVTLCKITANSCWANLIIHIEVFILFKLSSYDLVSTKSKLSSFSLYFFSCLQLLATGKEHRNLKTSWRTKHSPLPIHLLYLTLQNRRSICSSLFFLDNIVKNKYVAFRKMIARFSFFFVFLFSSSHFQTKSRIEMKKPHLRFIDFSRIFSSFYLFLFSRLATNFERWQR